MKSFIRRISGFKNRLTRLNDEEPITKLALAVIILLDVFVLSIIFGGLEDHTDQLTSPAEHFPSQCRQVFIEKDWTQANKIEKLQHLVLTDYNNYSYRHDSPFEKTRIAKMHPLCGQFFEKVRLIAGNEALKGLFVKRQEAGKQKDQLVKQYDRENEIYDTKLLEDIAGAHSSALSSMSESLKTKGQEIDRLNAEIKDIDRQLSNDPLVKDFWGLTRLGDEALRKTLIDDLNRFERWYLFKELLWQMLFLAPLLAVFSVWHVRSVRRARSIRGLISAHLIVVASIPIVFKIIHVVTELIPYHFFKELFKLLQRLHIIALWHYVVIVLAIAAGLFLVFIIQKKIFNKKRLYEKRLAKGACFSCGKTLPGRQAAVCPFCGTKQLTTCPACGNETYRHAQFCASCGQPLAE